MTTRICSLLLSAVLFSNTQLQGQGGPLGAEVNNFLVVRTQPSVVFAATGGGVFRSTDGGRTWSDRSAGLPAVDANDVDGPSWRLYAGLGGGEGVWRSVNGGLWVETTDVFGGLDVFAIAVHPENPMVVLASTSAGIYRSTNGGESWVEPGVVLPDTGISDIEFSPSDFDRVVAVGPGRIYDSADAGASWLGTALNAFARRVEFDPVTPERYYTATDSGMVVRHSPDSDLEFMNGFGNTSVLSILVDPTESDRLYAFTEFFGLFRSENRGESWIVDSQGLPTGLTFAAAAVTAETGRLIAGFNGTGVFATEDQGLNWVLSSDGMNAATVRAMAVSPIDYETVWAALDSGGLFKSTSGGETWMESRAGFLNRGSVTFEVDPQDPNRLYVGSVDPINFTTGGLARSEDGGSCWTQVPSSRDYRALAVDPTDGRFVLAGGTSNFFLGRDGFIGSQDYGETFSFSFFREFAAYNVLDLTFDTLNPAAVWAIANAGGVWSIWSSGNGGVSYFGPFFSSPVPFLQVEVDPTDSERVYLTTDGVGFIRSIPGESFQGANEGLPNGGLVSVLSLAISPDTPSDLLIATNFGVFHSSNHGGNWELTEVGLPPPRGVRQVIFGTGWHPLCGH